jgi:hypothetical protein
MASSTGGIPGASQSAPGGPPTNPSAQGGPEAGRKRKSKRTPENVADILDRRNESRRYAQVNFWDAWEDVYRASKCRTKPIMVTDKNGAQVEDKTRTNVAMPELSLIIRRKTARLTANPPQINYTVPAGGDTDLGEKLTAWAYQQFDRSGESREHRKTVQSSQTFGWAVSKLYWDTVEVERKLFRSFDKDSPQSATRSDLRQLDPNTPDGDEALTDDERTSAIAQYGNTTQVPQKTKQFEGPVCKNVFIGDFFMEPGAAYLDVSGWCVENYFESDVWLKKYAQKTYIDPDTQQEVPLFDPKAIQELADMPSWQPQFQQQPFDLRARLRTNALGQTQPLWPTKLLKGKRYDILECHTKDKDGQFWIEWVGNEKVYLGKMPYPWDLYGKYCYTEMVPMFDLLSAYGDSSPLLFRHLWLLHNAIVGSRRDLVANILRPLMKAMPNLDIADEQVDRALFRIITMHDPNGLQPLIEDMSGIAGAIQAAGEEEAQNMRMMALAEPNLTNVETGTDSNPQAGKTATTAVLAAKSADALTQFELDSLNWYFKDTGEKKLAMLQQVEPEQGEDGNYQPYEISGKYTGQVEGLTERYGKASVAKLDFMELQQEIQVEPAAMSMLSIDDDIRQAGALKLVEMAGQMPGIVDPHYAAHFYATTIRGIDPDKAVPPPKPQPPPPPKITMTVAAKVDAPADVQAALWQSVTGQPLSPQDQQEIAHDTTLRGVVKLSQAGDAADNLMSTKSVDDEPSTPMSKGVGNSNPSSKK